MKKVIAVIALVAFIVALPTSHFLMAKKGEKPAKVGICHETGHVAGYNSAGDELSGIAIFVSEKSLKGHCNHGDRKLIPNTGKVAGDPCAPDWGPASLKLVCDD